MNALDAFLTILEQVSPDSEFLVDTNFDASGVVPFDHAHMATHFVPLADQHLTGSSTVYILGYDGACVAAENYRWTSDVMRWVDQGNHVQYLLLNASCAALDRLKREARKIEEMLGGSLRVLGLDPAKPLTAEDAALVQGWTTFHFVAFDEPKQLWIEKCHPVGSMDAEGCRYFPPPLAEKSALWTLLWRQFEHITGTYGFELLSVGKEVHEQLQTA